MIGKLLKFLALKRLFEAIQRRRRAR